MAAARVAARTPVSQVARRQHDETGYRVHIAVGIFGQRGAMGADDRAVGGMIRRQPVGVRLGERSGSERLRPGRNGAAGLHYLLAVLRARDFLAGALRAGALRAVVAFLVGAFRAGAFAATGAADLPAAATAVSTVG